MILAIASMGTERIAPGIPHIQNQKTSEMTTRTGLRVNRLARSIGVTVSPSIKCKSNVKPRRKQRLPERVNGQQASEKKDQHAQGGAEDRHIVEQKGHRPPEDRVAHPREPHRQCHGDAYCRVHDRDRDQIRGDVVLDLLRDFDDLALVAEARQYLDETVEEDVAGHEKEKEKQHRREEAGGKVSGAREQLRQKIRQKSWASRRGGRIWRRCSSSKIFNLLQKPLQCIDGFSNEAQPLLKPRNTLWNLGCPSAGGA